MISLGTSTAEFERLDDEMLNVRASFHTGLVVAFLAAVFFFFTLLPLQSKYTLTKGSGQMKYW